MPLATAEPGCYSEEVSPYALLTGAILLLLAAPLIWMACRVAHDHAVGGVAFVAGLAGLMVALYAHHGTRLVDITLGVIGVATAALVVATTIGWSSRPRKPPRAASPPLPPARVHRPG